eukprot:TRINITY_DN18609_c0_g1_i2.p1 TRINITY_DN18609_c0_g1~~TRINITY_DN18609_c0_g1_i2.p1  ORF type:complete len:321 (+),score=49.46 TRINITY_DN18609_c0_g1_i2:54-965(+)
MKVAPEAEPGIEKGKILSVTSPSGRVIEYQFAGRCAPDDPWLLALHGQVPKIMYPASAGIRLARKDTKLSGTDALPFKIVGVARPGYDGSTLNKSYKEMAYEDQVVDILAVMDRVGAGKFAMAATSSGGTVALSVAHKVPDRVTAIQLDCCDASYAPGFPKGKKMNEPLEDGAPITYVDGASRPGSCMFNCCCNNPCCCFCVCLIPKGFLMDLYIETGPVPYKLEDIKCPVQIISGTADDQVDPNCSKFHASKLPNATLDVVRGMGHCQMENSDFDEKMHDLHELVTGWKNAPEQSVMRAESP